jgi:hypothetical protein
MLINFSTVILVEMGLFWYNIYIYFIMASTKKKGFYL